MSLPIISVALMAALVAAPAFASGGLYSELVQTESRLTQPSAMRGGADADQVERLQALARAAEPGSVERNKAELLLNLARQLAERPDGLAPSDTPQPTRLLRPSGSRISECQSAVALPAQSALLLDMAAGESIWLRVDAQSDEDLRVSTRGSSIDARLSAYLDCRVSQDPAFLEADDSFGLQAELGLSQASSGQSFWLVRLDNLGPDTGQAIVAAVGAVVISGSVVRDQDSSPMANHRVSAHRRQNGDSSYVTSSVVSSSGQFSIALAGPGEYGFRTSSTYSTNTGVIAEAWENAECTSQNEFWISACGTASRPISWLNLQPGDSRTLNFRLANSAVLGGTVASRFDQAAIADAEISVFDGALRFAGEARSDAAGRFLIGGLGSGPLYVRASAGGFAQSIYDDVPCVSYISCDPRQGTPILLAAGESRSISLQLRPRPSLRIEVMVGDRPATGTNHIAELLDTNGVLVRQLYYFSSPALMTDVPPGTYYLKVRSDIAFTGLYPNIECMTDCLSQLNEATAIVVEADTAGVNLQIQLRPYPSVYGRVTEAVGGAPIYLANLSLSRMSGGPALLAGSDREGNFRFNAVPPGSYRLLTWATGFQSEAYEDIPCDRNFSSTECIGATPIVVERSTTERVVDVDLLPAATITGRIRNRGWQYAAAYLYLLSADGTVIAKVQTTGVGSDDGYRARDLLSGTYRVAIQVQGRMEQIFPGVNCLNPAFNSFRSCDLSGSSPVTLTIGANTPDIDFTLAPQWSRPVRALSASTGQPLPGIAIDLWTVAGVRADTAITDSDGYAYPYHRNSFSSVDSLLSTYNTQGFPEQVYQDRPCPEGSAFFGRCSLEGATVVGFPGPNNAETLIFRMANSPRVFGDGFEP